MIIQYSRVLSGTLSVKFLTIKNQNDSHFNYIFLYLSGSLTKDLISVQAKMFSRYMLDKHQAFCFDFAVREKNSTISYW